EFDNNCDSRIYNLNRVERITAFVFTPWLAALKAFGDINHLGCWLSKQANATSAALSDLLEDEEITRHATLQNQAAIDCLLLAHGHGCQDFEGMRCFNLSLHSTSIQVNIQKLQGLVKDLKVDKSLDWVDELFGRRGITGWIASLITGVLWVFIVIIIVLL
ncbi:hypothetical protein N302_03476, partial [Corvus brachyrhynchos]